jgi:hypothetical protein
MPSTKILREVLVSIFIAMMLSYALVIAFMWFGPVFIDGEFAIVKAGEYTLITLSVVFWPVLYFRRRRSRKLDGKQ